MIHWVPLAFKLANGFLMSTFWSENFIACKQCHKRFGEISKGLVQLGPSLYSGWGFLSWTSPFVHCRVCKRKDLFFSSAFWLVFWTGPYYTKMAQKAGNTSFSYQLQMIATFRLSVKKNLSHGMAQDCLGMCSGACWQHHLKNTVFQFKMVSDNPNCHCGKFRLVCVR